MCPNKDASNRNLAPLDSASTYRFDNAYYVNLVNGTGLLESDQALMRDPKTAAIVTAYSSNSYLFSADFASSMTKLSNLVFPTINNIAQVVRFHVHEQTSPNLFSYFVIVAFFLLMSLHRLACGGGRHPSPGFEGDSDDLGGHGSHGFPKTGGGSDD
ncbi:hypothetical protein OIU84_009198 [Salix udensis]|uniref:peroxidase n=1 Tax=Salix udensis TaxID=889485 RepID=A0AAD6JST6_9ROSI|nr:hypothetical protein OIU84_009198 [Salix udensis]